MKGIFFHRFDIAVHAEPWELKNTLMCQLWHVGRLRVNSHAVSIAFVRSRALTSILTPKNFISEGQFLNRNIFMDSLVVWCQTASLSMWVRFFLLTIFYSSRKSLTQTWLNFSEAQSNHVVQNKEKLVQPRDGLTDCEGNI